MTIEDATDRGFPWVTSTVLAFSPRARRELGPMLSGHGEFLPLSTPMDVVLFSPNVVVDLDETEAVVSRLPSGRITRVSKYAFMGELPDAPVMRIRQLREGPLLISDSLVVAAGLVGLGVRHVV
jgi:hypothetical protein